LAEQHPNRLYMFESTAFGFNHYYQMWCRARDDELTQRHFFIGWWAKEIYRIEKTDARYPVYMQDKPTDEEREKAAIVERSYGRVVSPEQLAWYRFREETRSADVASMAQEFPWHEEEAFVETGNHFFPAKRLGEDLRLVMEPGRIIFKGYRYTIGEHFTTTNLDILELDSVQHAAHAELRVWAPPMPKGRYVIGVDPAYGRNDWKDRHAIEVYRCYADRLVQVAEYATPEPETYQIVWVLAHLASQYKDCLINIEVGGPGAAVMTGLKQLKAQLRALASMKGEPGIPKDFMRALEGARWYLYHRPDTLGMSGFAKGWKTNADNKLQIMNEMRDSYFLKRLVVYSGPLLAEMKTIIQDGAEIAAAGKGKDDRVFATCFAHKAWTEWVQQSMIADGLTWQRIAEAEARGIGTETNDGFIGGIVKAHFRGAEQARRDQARAARWGRPFRCTNSPTISVASFAKKPMAKSAPPSRGNTTAPRTPSFSCRSRNADSIKPNS